MTKLMIFKSTIPELSWNVLKSILAISLALNTVLILAAIAPMQERLPIVDNTSKTEPTFASLNEYVFIEHQIHTHVKVIEGSYHGELIDSPTYSFDEKTGTLRGWINFDVNDTLKVVLGSGSSISGVGGGRDTILYGVYVLPHHYYELIILSVNMDGTVSLRWQGVLITLRSGEEWKNITARTVVQEIGKAELTITDRITNYGILSKSAIEN